MTQDTSVVTRAHAAIIIANSELDALDASLFSPSAKEVLRSKSSQYTADLLKEALKVSKRHNADIVSAAHVERASEYLVASSSRRIYRHLGPIGGMLLGAALSNILSMVSAAQYTGQGTIIAVTLGVVGAFLIALHIAKD